MSVSVEEFAVAYAKLGVAHWNSELPQVKSKAGSMGVEIAASEELAQQAVETPFGSSASDDEQMYLVPMPCGQRKVYAAFFAPWLPSQSGSADLSFDLVVLSQQSGPVAFRFEAGSVTTDTMHGYDHAQLSESLGGGKVALANPISPLPKTYPAFPIPSTDTLTRFLALVVAMHGYPRGIDHILEQAFSGRPDQRKTCLDLARAMLGNGNGPVTPASPPRTAGSNACSRP